MSIVEEIKRTRQAAQSARARGNWRSCRDLDRHFGRLLTRFRRETVGKRLRIKRMDGEPAYDGREGTVTSIDDALQIHGTWGGLAIVPGVDEYEII